MFRPRIWWTVPSHDKILSLSLFHFVPGQWRNFCSFVPKSCTVRSSWKSYWKPHICFDSMTSRFPNWNSILGCQPVRQLGRNECKNWGNRCQVERKLIGLHSNSEFFLTTLLYKVPLNSTGKSFFTNVYWNYLYNLHIAKYFEEVIDPWTKGNLLLRLKKSCTLKSISDNINSRLPLLQGNKW